MSRIDFRWMGALHLLAGSPSIRCICAENMLAQCLPIRRYVRAIFT
jgi:hypothetical protein